MPIFKGPLEESEIVHIVCLGHAGLVNISCWSSGPEASWDCVSHLMPSSSRVPVLPLDHADWTPIFYPGLSKGTCGCVRVPGREQGTLWLAGPPSHDSLPSWVPRKA